MCVLNKRNRKNIVSETEVVWEGAAPVIIISIPQRHRFWCENVPVEKRSATLWFLFVCTFARLTNSWGGAFDCPPSEQIIRIENS